MRLIGLFLFVLSFSSCAIQQNMMWRDTEKMETLEYPPNNEYMIAQNDLLQITIQPNEGINLIDPSGTPNSKSNSMVDFSRTNQSFHQYLVDPKGQIKLPVFGYVNLEGKTICDAELFLEEQFKTVFKKPYVRVQVLSRKVIVFPGGSGKAQVLQLPTLNTSLMEALALAGGINTFGKAKAVKIIRRVDDEYIVYRIDFRTVDNLAASEISLQSNDMVYIESVRNIAGEVVQELSPYFSLLSSALLIYGLLTGGF